MILSRRRLFTASAALLAAPSIVRVSSLMPVSMVKVDAFEAFNAAYLAPLVTQMGDLVFYAGREWRIVATATAENRPLFEPNRLPTFARSPMRHVKQSRPLHIP